MISDIVRKNYKEEIFGATVYEELAKIEKNVKVKEVLEELANGEKSHASFWKEVAESRGVELEELGFFDRLKIKILKLFRRVFGLPLTLKLVERGEISDAEKYYQLSKAAEFNDTERQKLSSIMMQELVHEDLLVQTQINADKIRDAIYAVSDGLIEVLAGVSGLASILASPFLVALGGIIIGVSGTISMSIGAYLSSSSENDIRKSKLKKEKLRALLGQAYSSNEGDNEINKNSESVKITAISYILGALVPILPFLLGLGGLLGLITSYAFTGVVTFIVGGIIGILSDVNPFKKGAVMAGLAIVAALVTHLIGIAFHFIGY
ncbi:VIT1/CCC1 transporter family protein [Acidianus ambivalens]|uniref:Ferritin, CCC1 n=1 Tax=Acidianus ambivalens TaxID=2283 RepID=A0A650CV93_ACIAM|nr:VIT1/CCC1 family protein [Acidianus ambivalens]MQL55625.1 ferritin, CCC1 [Acidianus ambivalens]QGR21794.1 ferritin, CCC1 [Acidianus ambivalens]